MKLAIVTHNVVSGDGQGRVNLEIANLAQERGHEVTLFADRVDSELIKPGIVWRRISPVSYKPQLLSGYSFARQMNKVLKEEESKFDLVVGNGYTMTYPHDISICHLVHSRYTEVLKTIPGTHSGPRGWYQALYHSVQSRNELKVFDRVSIVVGVSEKVRQELVSAGVPAQKIRVIYNGVNLQEFKPGTADRVAFGLPADRLVCLFTGDIRTKGKNLDTVLKALVQLPDVHLAVAGSTRRSPFPLMVEQLGLKDRVHFLGYRKDIAELMRAVDLFVFPTRYDSFGLVILEAMASGVPVITAKTAGAAEVMTSETGRVIDDPNDEKSLVAAISHFASNASARHAAGAAAREQAKEFNWTRMATSYLRLFEETRP